MANTENNMITATIKTTLEDEPSATNSRTITARLRIYGGNYGTPQKITVMRITHPRTKWRTVLQRPRPPATNGTKLKKTQQHADELRLICSTDLAMLQEKTSLSGQLHCKIRAQLRKKSRYCNHKKIRTATWMQNMQQK